MYDYNYSEDYLMHYGVKGMKWGVRRASKLQAKANIARTSANEWDEMAANARAKGATKKSARKAAKYEQKAVKYEQNAAKDRADADKYQQKADRKVEKRYAKAGKAAGSAEYHRERGKQVYDTHERGASVLDKTASKFDKEGKYMRAEAARASAEALRSRGRKEKADYDKLADDFMRKSDKLNKKASDFASETNINVGKNKVDSILKASKQKGYESAKAMDEWSTEMEIEDKFGSTAREIYSRTRR